MTNYSVQGGPAVPAKVTTSGASRGGPAIPVYQILAGDGYKVQGGPGVPMRLITDPAYPRVGGAAFPIQYVAPGNNPQAQGGTAIPVYCVNQADLLAAMGVSSIPWYLSGGIPQANCIAAYKAIGAAGLAASYVNLANPGTYNLTAPTAAPTFDIATGWTFNGSTQYLATGITPPDARTWTMIARFADAVNGYISGYYFDTGFGFIMSPARDGWRLYYNGNVQGFHPHAEVTTSGVQAIAGGKGYIDGVEDATFNTAANSGEIYLGADKRDAGTPPVHAYFNGTIAAFAVYDTVLTQAQIEAVTAAMNFF